MEKIMKNIMESIVEQRIDELLPSMDCCKCEQCRLDIEAIVLNKMPAKYVVSTKGEIMSHLNVHARQNTADLTATILQAAAIVSKHPRHDK